GVRYALAAEIDASSLRARTLAVWTGQEDAEEIEYDARRSPCGGLADGRAVLIADGLSSRYPDTPPPIPRDAKSYLGVPMQTGAGKVVGYISVLDTAAMSDDEQRASVLRIFAARAAAELERMRASERLQRALAEVEQLKNRLQAENVYL